jgi:arylsulfatase A-like enzyme
VRPSTRRSSSAPDKALRHVQRLDQVGRLLVRVENLGPALRPNWESVADLEQHHKPSTHTLFRDFQQVVWGGAPDQQTRPDDFTVAPSPMEPRRLGIGMAPYRYWHRGLDSYTSIMTAVDEQIGRVVAAVPKHD